MTHIHFIFIFVDFPSHPLYFMYGNFFYKNKETDEYSPAELAIVKFTFRDGVLKHFHTFIKPGECAQCTLYILIFDKKNVDFFSNIFYFLFVLNIFNIRYIVLLLNRGYCTWLCAHGQGTFRFHTPLTTTARCIW